MVHPNIGNIHGEHLSQHRPQLQLHLLNDDINFRATLILSPDFREERAMFIENLFKCLGDVMARFGTAPTPDQLPRDVAFDMETHVTIQYAKCIQEVSAARLPAFFARAGWWSYYFSSRGRLKVPLANDRENSSSSEMERR